MFTRPSPGADDLLTGPIRGELLGAEQLAERVTAVTRAQRVRPGRRQRRTPLLARLEGTRRILEDAHERLGAAAGREVDVGPAGDWLLDNFHVVQEHIREVGESLPRHFYRELPELASGSLAGYPRLYELAITLISHTEGRVDAENVDLVVSAFQRVSPLSIGELWALPAMLRLGLIENVRRMSLRTVQRLAEVEAADAWATRMLAASEQGTAALSAALTAFISDPPQLSAVFVTRFLHHLRASRGEFPPLMWLEAWISEEAVNAEEAAARSMQRLALTQLMMANSITSLRAIARMDWRRFVERQSVVESALREDPSGHYASMTFATRDHYRHVVERIAKRTGLAETAVAERAVELARAHLDEVPEDPRRAHVGFYLIGDGLGELERLTSYKPTVGERVHRWVLHHPNVVFVGGILAGTLAALAGMLALAGPEAWIAWPLVLPFALIPASEVAVSAVNQLVAAFLPPRLLPKLELREKGGVPPEFRTAVVIPLLFGSVDAVREAIENLEVQFLANREAHLHFAILSDFTDSPTETREEDAAILEAAIEGVRALNARYAGGAQDAFFLFHRPRRWNPRQGVWMGWERKRGKLAELNRFLRGGATDAFSVVIGDLEQIQRVRFVITLDADTVLPPDAAPLLIGALGHPLNRAVYNPAQGRVVRGYGILQPRVGVSLPSAHRSRFAAIHSGHPGVDPYTTAVSDVYQDLYGEGSYTGKGIYDVDTFEQATHGRFPENTLLSHDLIEGSYARAGLVTDINVYDDYPTRYLTYTRRKHRWIRGDWQLLQWLRRRVPGPEGRERNRLSILSQWKIFDNLRRSIVEIAQLALLVAGWTILPGSPARWTMVALVAIAAPWILASVLAILRPPLDKSWRAYYAAVGRDMVTSAQQVLLAITFLPHQASVSADAIARTLWRLLITKRSLLEWQTASQTERIVGGDRAEVWRRMWPAVAIAVIIAIGVALMGARSAAPWSLAFAAAPLIALWLISPTIAHRLSAPAVRRERRLSAARAREATRYALLHWRFFDRFVSEETNWLAPDNFQEDPSPVLAMRTSPTNIGLQLLSTVSARDLGFIGTQELTRRLELAFRSLERMRRFRGHFYNWYDLHDLRVLEPAYISTVDSGNLAGHLIALRQACLAIAVAPVLNQRLRGVLDASIGLAGERLEEMATSDASDNGPARRALTAARHQLHLARAAAMAADRIDVSPEALASVAGLLEAARDALTSQSLPRMLEQPATEWIAWSLRRIAERQTMLRELATSPARAGEDDPGAVTWRELGERSTAASELIAQLQLLADRAYDYAKEMDFRFLFDDQRKLFSIGYQPGSHALDPSYYDLLASEARLASFIAVAKDDVAVEHWFHLGRALTRAGGETALVSWSGSMFEYLMPVLVMRALPFTMLDQTYWGAFRRQVAYGAEQGVPWGVSECAYNVRDRHLTYQYRAFGVPDLGLKRGLGRDLVVAPYATALAALIDPVRALANFAAIERAGALGWYGFRDALDYTRPDPGRKYAIVKTFMAHHIGMSVVALTNALTGQIWQRRFHDDPLVRAAELLLHERVPRRLVLHDAQAAPDDESLPDPELERPPVREIGTPDTPQPHVALLGHPPYTIMVSHCGGGYSRYEDLAVTRWRADGTRDHTGQFCYINDVSVGRVWSAAHQPVCAPADWFLSLLATDRVTFHRADGVIETRTEIAVVPQDAAEVRRVTVTNNGDTPREVELTSYGEIVLAKPDADRSHPAFANLFVETEWHEWCSAITATRRPRAATERSLWCVHVVDTDRDRVGPVTCETDRARFVGRGRSTRDPIALETDGPLSGTTGAVLDPIFALRTRVHLDPGQAASVSFTTLVATSRKRAFELADRYHDPHAAQRALDLAWTATQVELRELDITPATAAIFQELAGHLFYSNPALRASQDELRLNRGPQQLLWAQGISGDWPILLATIESADGLPTLRQLFAAHHYWRRHGMTVDLVVLNAHGSSYLQELHEKIIATLSASSDAGVLDRPGGVFVRRRDLLSVEELRMLRAHARVHVLCDGRSLGKLIAPARAEEKADTEAAESGPPLRRSGRHVAIAEPRGRPALVDERASLAADIASRRLTPTRRGTALEAGSAPLRLDNGYGGLAPNDEYQIRLHGDRIPPAPWANVIANPHGGFIVTERGAGCSWAENSQFFRLTPWHNDPVSDPVSEALYLRDEATGELWSPTPAPISHDTPYVVTHAPGLSTFDHVHAGIATRLSLGMAEGTAIKLSILRLTNRGARRRELTLTAYAEWTLGTLREHTQHQVHTQFDAERGALLARNFFDPQFARWMSFLTVSEPVTSYTCDRREFLGRNGSVTNPAALQRSSLDGTTGAGLDPCAALQCVLELGPGETREVAVLLGAADGEAEVRRAIAQFGDVERASAAIADSVRKWTDRLSVITVRTPEPSFDAMMNRWMLYQALACRMWGRSALYQSSGAYGFRDQLQDTMAFVYAEAGVAREHILHAASRQFVEGDVQHWWHPPNGRGVRTKFSDDLAWLPFVVDHYLRVTGDASVLDESVPFITMRPLEPHEHEVYDLPQVADEQASLYEHCLRALRRACTAGAHGLPLIGVGDWNDGMNRVGVEGRGESVWLAWFLVTTLRAFADHAESRDDDDVAADLHARADAYVEAVEANGWDGEWYRRAYFDNGAVLGSAANDECRIDSIAQSWSVISGAGAPDRQSMAMRSLEEHLVNEDARLIMLLTPAFDATPHDPGYIKGYLPGVRENGAQYTHAALWAVLAVAMRGDGERAFELFQMLNPLMHARTAEEVATYKVEPFVVAADVYTARGHVGRGGWTWYTGSASWMYRVGLEAILGFTKRGQTLSIDPRVPASWPAFGIEYRYGGSLYVIDVQQPGALVRAGTELTLDGQPLQGNAISLVDDGKRHEVLVRPRATG